jgi:hypothetical protein
MMKGMMLTSTVVNGKLALKPRFKLVDTRLVLSISLQTLEIQLLS